MQSSFVEVTGVNVADQLDRTLDRLRTMGIAPNGSRFYDYRDVLRAYWAIDHDDLRARNKDREFADAMMESADFVNAMRLPGEYLSNLGLRTDIKEIMKGPPSPRMPAITTDGSRNKLFQFATAAWLAAHSRLSHEMLDLADTSFFVNGRSGPVECKRIVSSKKSALTRNLRYAAKQIAERCKLPGMYGVIAIDVSIHIGGGFRLDSYADKEKVRDRSAKELQEFCDHAMPLFQASDVATQKVLGLLVRHVVQGRVGRDVQRCTQWTTIPCHSPRTLRGQRFDLFRAPFTPPEAP